MAGALGPNPLTLLAKFDFSGRVFAGRPAMQSEGGEVRGGQDGTAPVISPYMTRRRSDECRLAASTQWKRHWAC